MTTVRQIERLWNAAEYRLLLGEMLAGRSEASGRLLHELSGAVPTAAIVLIRLDELAQAHVPLYSKLLKIVLAAQDADGGWTDPLTTALCLRALMASRGDGTSITRGLNYLAQLQKPEGLWPQAPLRRMPADPFVSAFVLSQLGSDARFRRAVQFSRALQWFDLHAHGLEADPKRLWEHTAIRCQPQRAAARMADHQPALTWS
ncbi:MAG TPA: hypothetical protein VH518_17675 [Tepidisphaeraceae bacterium]|jgi:hypothetical protein